MSSSVGTVKDIDFHIKSDGYLRLELDDGSILRVRPVVVSVAKSDQATPEGEPIYAVQSLIHVALESYMDEKGERKP